MSASADSSRHNDGRGRSGHATKRTHHITSRVRNANSTVGHDDSADRRGWRASGHDHQGGSSAGDGSVRLVAGDGGSERGGGRREVVRGPEVGNSDHSGDRHVSLAVCDSLKGRDGSSDGGKTGRGGSHRGELGNSRAGSAPLLGESLDNSLGADGVGTRVQSHHVSDGGRIAGDGSVRKAGSNREGSVNLGDGGWSSSNSGIGKAAGERGAGLHVGDGGWVARDGSITESSARSAIYSTGRSDGLLGQDGNKNSLGDDAVGALMSVSLGRSSHGSVEAGGESDESGAGEAMSDSGGRLGSAQRVDGGELGLSPGEMLVK